MKSLATHLFFIAAVVAAGWLMGAAFPPGGWFDTLAKPPLHPPNWVFAPVWTGLYVLIGMAGARQALADPREPPLQIWLIQMGLNLLWTPSFFGLRSPGFALVVLLLLIGAAGVFAAVVWRRGDTVSAVLFLPYLAWLLFATYLNAGILLMN